jgi:hypothetical protein
VAGDSRRGHLNAPVHHHQRDQHRLAVPGDYNWNFYKWIASIVCLYRLGTGKIITSGFRIPDRFFLISDPESRFMNPESRFFIHES